MKVLHEKKPLTRWVRFRRGLFLVAGFATLIATSDVQPNIESADTQAAYGVQVDTQDAQPAASSFLRVGLADPIDGMDAGAETQDKVAVRLEGTTEVLGYDGVTDWHRLCPSLQSCTLRFVFDWPEGERSESVSAEMNDSLAASGPICTEGQAFSESVSLTLTPITR